MPLDVPYSKRTLIKRTFCEYSTEEWKKCCEHVRKAEDKYFGQEVSVDTKVNIDPGGPVVIILASGSEVHGFNPGRGRWIFSECKNPVYDFLRKGSKAVGPVS